MTLNRPAKENADIQAALDAAAGLLANDLAGASQNFEDALRAYAFRRDDGGFGAIQNGRFFEKQLAHFLNVAGRFVGERFRDLVSIGYKNRDVILAVRSATTVVTSVVREHCNPENILLRTFPALAGECIDLPPGLTPPEVNDPVDAICSRIKTAFDSNVDRIANRTLIYGFRNAASTTNSEPAGTKLMRRKRRLNCWLSDDARKRCNTIQELCAAKCRGPEYCREMDRRGILTPWRKDGCPPTYSEAYKNEKWRKRIQDEKSRHYKHPPVRGDE